MCVQQHTWNDRIRLSAQIRIEQKIVDATSNTAQYSKNFEIVVLQYICQNDLKLSKSVTFAYFS